MSRCASSRSGLSAATPVPWSTGSRACAARTGASARSSTRRSGACSRSGQRAGRLERASATSRPRNARTEAGPGTREARRTRTTPPPRSRLFVRPESALDHARSSAGLAYLRKLQRPDGGFALVAGRSSDAQSTAWAIQAFIAAKKEPGRRAFRYLSTLRRADGSYRYSKRYAVTPVWVTSQVLPALARQPFPLR